MPGGNFQPLAKTHKLGNTRLAAGLHDTGNHHSLTAATKPTLKTSLHTNKSRKIWPCIQHKVAFSNVGNKLWRACNSKPWDFELSVNINQNYRRPFWLANDQKSKDCLHYCKPPCLPQAGEQEQQKHSTEQREKSVFFQTFSSSPSYRRGRAIWSWLNWWSRRRQLAKDVVSLISQMTANRS